MLTLKTVELRLESYLNSLVAIKNLSEKTMKAYSCDITSFIKWCSNNNLIEITENTIIDYIGYCVNEKKIKDTSIKRAIISLKAYFKYVSPINNMFKDFSYTFKTAKRLPKTLTKKEISGLISCLSTATEKSTSSFKKYITTRDLAIIELLFGTGIRIGELSEINIEDISLKEQTILIRGKGRKERIIYISNDISMKRIKNWLYERNTREYSSTALFINTAPV